MKKKGHLPNSFTYSSLMWGYFEAGDSHKAILIWKEMADNNCNHHEVCYSILINGLCKNGKLKEALMLWKQMLSRGIKLDVVAYSSMIHGFCNAQLVEQGMKLFDQMLCHEPKLQPDVVTYNILLNAFCMKNSVSRAIDILNTMLDHGCDPGFITCDIFLKTLRDNIDPPQDGREFLDELVVRLIKRQRIVGASNIIEFEKPSLIVGAGCVADILRIYPFQFVVVGSCVLFSGVRPIFGWFYLSSWGLVLVFRESAFFSVVSVCGIAERFVVFILFSVSVCGIAERFVVQKAELVILCIGKYSGFPNIREFPFKKGPKVFKGKVIHSMDYSALDNENAAELITDKRVTVVGSGKSALDIAAECASANANGVAHPCTIIQRTIHWFIPDFKIGGINLGFLYFNRFAELSLHKPGEPFLLSLVATLLSPLRMGISKLVETYLRWKLPLKKYGLIPNHSFLQDTTTCRTGILPGFFFDKVKNGSIVIKKSQSFSFYKDGLIINGESKPHD
ncbi:putative flavin-containing monooxygenase [Trifolium repens]|nr:putative flavin-containing monooxygenase [Trifolium repens]